MTTLQIPERDMALVYAILSEKYFDVVDADDDLADRLRMILGKLADVLPASELDNDDVWAADRLDRHASPVSPLGQPAPIGPSLTEAVQRASSDHSSIEQ